MSTFEFLLPFLPLLVTDLNHFASLVTFTDESLNPCVPVGRCVPSPCRSLLMLFFKLDLVLYLDKRSSFYATLFWSTPRRFNFVKIIADI